jgi:membrane protein YqaA with SNARE-associated domain
MWMSWLHGVGELSPMLLCVLAIVGAAVGSVLPLSPTEPFLLALAAVAPRHLAIPLALLATVGHMSGKTLVYAGGRRADRVLSARHQRAVDRAGASMRRAPAAQSLVTLVSGATGLPPFYGVTVLSGALRVPFGRYFLFGTIGRAARFGALVLLPRVLGSS